MDKSQCRRSSEYYASSIYEDDILSRIALNKYRLFALSVLIPVKADCTIVPDLRNGGPSEWRPQTHRIP